MTEVKPSELYTAARISDALVYAVGVAGVVGGGLLFQGGQLGLALVAWAMTFCVAAGLRLLAWMAKGVAQMLQRSDRLIEEVDHLAREQRQSPPDPSGGQQTPPSPRRGPPDPYERWSGWH